MRRNVMAQVRQCSKAYRRPSREGSGSSSVPDLTARTWRRWLLCGRALDALEQRCGDLRRQQPTNEVRRDGRRLIEPAVDPDLPDDRMIDWMRVCAISTSATSEPDGI
jgi:hypothetical protein